MNIQREVLRHILLSGMSNRMIGRIKGISHNTVKRYRNIVAHRKLDWDAIEEMDDTKIESLLQTKRYRIESKRMPNYGAIHKHLQDPHVTLQLEWEDYCLANPGYAYSYSQFTHYYREYVGKLDITMRQNHRAGEIVFIDFAGRTIPYKDAETGEKRNAQIFVGVLGCSNYTFVCAVPSQSISDFIDAHNRMFLYFGGIPEVGVPDNLKAAVIKAGSEPVLNRTYLEMAKYYGIVIVPARVRRPQDKSKAEIGVQLASRWIMAPLRNRQFFSIEEINAAITDLLHKLNERPFKKLPGCRRSRFEELDKPLLKLHPGKVFEYAEWTSSRKISADYHMPVRDHYYSVPHGLVGARVEARVTKNTVEIFNHGKRVASHVRSYENGGHTTLPEHQPKAHRHYAEQTPERLLEWAKGIGLATEAAVQFQFDSRPHALLGLKACSTLRRLAKDYGAERFEAACKRAESIGSLTVKSIRSILRRGLTELTDEHTPIQVNLPFHNNVRGSSYYTDGGH